MLKQKNFFFDENEFLVQISCEYCFAYFIPGRCPVIFIVFDITVFQFCMEQNANEEKEKEFRSKIY